MYAIIESGGKQYRISEGTKVRVERLSGSADEEVTLGQVLVVNDGERTVVGAP
ncbi:MAG: 50S ribosomal protein L21, partial [Syntrophorhabdales bacterium]